MFKNQKGFAPLFLLIAIFLITIGGIGYMTYQDTNKAKESGKTTQIEEDQVQGEVKATNSPSQTPTQKPILQVTKQLTPTPSPVPTDSTCPYNLTKEAGSIKVRV